MKKIILIIILTTLIFLSVFVINYNSFENKVTRAGKNYISDNENKLPNFSQDFVAEIPVKKLIKEKYLKNNIKSPSKDVELNYYYIEVTNNNNELKYEIKHKKEG